LAILGASTDGRLVLRLETPCGESSISRSSSIEGSGGVGTPDPFDELGGAGGSEAFGRMPIHVPEMRRFPFGLAMLRVVGMIGGVEGRLGGMTASKAIGGVTLRDDAG
jgi:hypothetical protein